VNDLGRHDFQDDLVSPQGQEFLPRRPLPLLDKEKPGRVYSPGLEQGVDLMLK
jgi:hypothetical protein